MVQSYAEYQEVLAFLNTCDDARPRKKNHRLPLYRYALSDCDYFFTLCARNQGMPFTDPRLALQIIETLRWRRETERWMMYCYCLMPDHLHFILRLAEAEARMLNAGSRGIVPKGILEQVGQFKRYTTTQLWWKAGGQGRLWQRSSYDRVIRYDDSVEDAVIYVLNNPVRKGLVENWQEYPYSAIVDPWT